ncbi:DUF397 domain-containing protein [Glycomyces algeriensis]|uniref:DUF397 domain-containing protein n=1 Tax=Glycomyces algeriensis TaxID=256037 RepID=A0A9W6G8H7_9ACTN|nr:hypothetical protein GALLR39Z86_20080 [Glycomyces algeriensis]
MSHDAGVDARWARGVFRKSSRSNGSGDGNCVAVAVQGGEVAMGDTKSPVADTYAHLRVSSADLRGLLAAIKADAPR